MLTLLDDKASRNILILSCWRTGLHSLWSQTVTVGCACTSFTKILLVNFTNITNCGFRAILDQHNPHVTMGCKIIVYIDYDVYKVTYSSRRQSEFTSTFAFPFSRIPPRPKLPTYLTQPRVPYNV